MKNFATIFFLMLVFTLFTSCQSTAPYASDLTTTQPKREDVIGVYRFKEQTISQAPIDTVGQNSTIVLKADGTYQANNIPNVFGGPDAQIHKHISADGNWTIDTVGEVGDGYNNKSEWGLRLTSINENLNHIGFTGNKAPYGLMITFDDPDLGEVMKFQKVH